MIAAVKAVLLLLVRVDLEARARGSSGLRAAQLSLFPVQCARLKLRPHFEQEKSRHQTLIMFSSVLLRESSQ